MATEPGITGAPTRAPANPTTRRALLGAIAAAPLIAVPVVAAAPDPNARLMAEFDVLDAWSDRVNGAPEAEFEAWERLCDRLYDEAEALPCTAENVRVKVRAVKSIYHEDPSDFLEREVCASDRIALQVVSVLMGAL